MDIKSVNLNNIVITAEELKKNEQGGTMKIFKIGYKEGENIKPIKVSFDINNDEVRTIYSVINTKKNDKPGEKKIDKYGITIDVSNKNDKNVKELYDFFDKLDDKIREITKNKLSEKNKGELTLTFWSKGSWKKSVLDLSDDKKKVQKDTIGKFQIFVKDEIVDSKIKFTNFNDEKLTKELANKRKKLIADGKKNSPESANLKKEYIKIKNSHNNLKINSLNKMISSGSIIKKLVFYVGKIKVVTSLKGYGYDLYLNELNYIPMGGVKKVELDEGMSDEDSEDEKIVEDVKKLNIDSIKLNKTEEKIENNDKKINITKKSDDAGKNVAEYDPNEEDEEDDVGEQMS